MVHSHSVYTQVLGAPYTAVNASPHPEQLLVASRLGRITHTRRAYACARVCVRVCACVCVCPCMCVCVCVQNLFRGRAECLIPNKQETLLGVQMCSTGSGEPSRLRTDSIYLESNTQQAGGSITTQHAPIIWT